MCSKMESNEDDDDILNSIIVFDYGAEEIELASGKRKRTTTEQFSKLVSFMQTNPDFTKGTIKADANQELAWENLTLELNAMGPPAHSSKEWRTVWSQYKANKKRKVTATQLETNVRSSLESSSHEKTVECGDVTLGVGGGGLKDENNDNCTVELLKKVVELEIKILESLEDLKKIISEGFMRRK